MSRKIRIEWIDIAKGISIILVVYGHSGLNSVPILGDWLHSFRMPFFFMVSGVLFSGAKYDSLYHFLQKRVTTLYRPYLIFSMLLMFGIWILDDARFSTPEKMLQYIKTGWEGWALWFIPILSLTEILFYKINLIGNWGGQISILCCSAILGRLSYLLGMPNPYNLWFVFTAVLFYGLGSLLKTTIIKLSEQCTTRVIGLSSLFLLVSFVYMLSPELPEFAVNNMASVWIYPAALSGALFMCTLAMILGRISNSLFAIVKSSIIYFGKNSYVVLAFHQIILLLLGKSGLFPNGVLQRFAMWIILVALIFIITNYCPSIIGRSKPNKLEV